MESLPQTVSLLTTLIIDPNRKSSLQQSLLLTVEESLESVCNVRVQLSRELEVKDILKEQVVERDSQQENQYPDKRDEPVLVEEGGDKHVQTETYEECWEDEGDFVRSVKVGVRPPHDEHSHTTEHVEREPGKGGGADEVVNTPDQGEDGGDESAVQDGD